MKYLSQFGLASVLVALTVLVPAKAFAARNSATPRTHTQSVHDRTPTVHTHASQSHRHG